MHLDPYGRSWRYAAIHDLSQALQISREVAEFGIDTDLRLHFRGHQPEPLPKDDEPYLLKTEEGWELVLRTGDGPLDYCVIDDLNPHVAALMIAMHRRDIPNGFEARAFDALVGDDVP